MDENIKFDYYYGIEADQFSFYRVPRLLIKDERFKGLSSDAKLLYIIHVFLVMNKQRRKLIIHLKSVQLQ